MKKITALILAMLILASCSQNTVSDESSAEKATGSESEESSSASDSSSETEIETETETAKLEPELPDVKYEGYTYKVLGWNETIYPTERDLFADDLTGEPMNDSVFQRNLSIENKYGITLQMDFDALGSYSSYIGKLIKTNEDNYQIIYSRGIEFGSYVEQGYFQDITKFDYIELDKPWWDKNSVTSLSVGGKAFGAISDITTRDKHETCIVFFNKTLASNYGLPDLYSIVDEGSWTIDKMLELSEGVSADTNGNGKSDEGDMFAAGTNSVGVTMLLHGGGARYFSKDESDTPYLAIGEERTVNLTEKILKLFADTKTLNNSSRSGIACVDDFGAGNELFLLYALCASEELREIDIDFGVLPMVKYEETQTVYENTVSPHGTSILCIPITVADNDRAAVIADALSAESYYTLTEAYYDKVIKYKYMRDIESGRMLDMIFASRVYDMGEFYRIGGIADVLGTLANECKTDFASAIKTTEKVSEKKLKKFVEKVLENNN